MLFRLLIVPCIALLFVSASVLADEPTDGLHPIAKEVKEQLDRPHKLFKVTITLNCEAGRKGQVAKAVLLAGHQTRQQPGNLRYQVRGSDNHPNVSLLRETWTSLDAFDANLKQPHFEELLKVLEQTLVKAPDIEVPHPVQK